MSTLQETNAAMMYLAALFPNYKFAEPTIKAYHTILKDLPVEAMTSAVEKLGSENTFFPKAAEIRQAAFALMQGDELPLAIEGWNQVTSHWSGKRQEFHELTEKTVRLLGGMRSLGMTQNKDLPFVRANFIKTFEQLRSRQVEDRRQLPAVKKYKQLQAAEINNIFKQIADKKRIPDKGLEDDLPF